MYNHITTTATATTQEEKSVQQIAREIEQVHIYDGELAFNGCLYETAVKVVSWILDMNPKDVNEWIELHSRHYSESPKDVQKWLDFNESNHHLNEEWDKMLVLLSENYLGVKKLRSLERLEKALIIGSMIEAAIDPNKNGIF